MGRELVSRVAAVAAVVVVLGLGAGPGTAWAHTELVETQPAQDETVAEQIDDVVLVFDHPISFASVQMTDPSGAAVDTTIETGLTTQLREPHRELQQVDGEWVDVTSDVGHAARVVPAALPTTGAYEVAYQYTAEDGHNEQGTVTFTYEGPTGPVPAPEAWEDYQPEPTPEPTPVVANPAPDRSEDPSPAAAAGQDESGDTMGMVAGVATGSALVLGVGAVVVGRRRGRSGRPTGRAGAPGRQRAHASTGRLPTKRLF